MRDEAERIPDEVPERAVAGDDEVHAFGRGHELPDPLLRREPPDEEHLRRLGLDAGRSRELDAVRDRAHVAPAAAARSLGEGLGDADHDRGAADDEADEPRVAACQLEVGEAAGGARPVQREHEAASREDADCAGGEPVRVHEVAAARGPAHGEDHRDDEERREPGPPADVPDEASAVGKAEVAVAARREHRNVDVAGEPAHEIGDEPAGEVPFVPRVRGGEVDDAERLVVRGRGNGGRGGRFHRDTHRQPSGPA